MDYSSSLYIPFTGFLVGVLVTLTGLGGGVLLLPLLILGLKVPPLIAVGSSAVYMFFTKVGATAVHWQRGNIDWRLALALSAGSIPGALCGVVLLSWLHQHFASGINEILRTTIGVLLIGISLLSVAFDRLTPRTNNSSAPGLAAEWNYKGAVLTGLLGGFVVGLSSIGSGSVIVALLLLIYGLRPALLVGTDVFHAVILTAVTSLAHMRLGTVNYHLVGLLLLGSIPGVGLGAVLSSRLPALWTRRVLFVLIIGTGIRMVHGV